MRRFAGYLCAALMFAVMIVSSSRVEGRDDPKEKKTYDCSVCDNEAYESTANKALMYMHVAGVDEGMKEHRARRFMVQGGTAFAFREHRKAPVRICTAWHVVAELREWNGTLFAVYLWNMHEIVPLVASCYNANADIVVLDFEDPDYEYQGSVLNLGDEKELEKGDDVVAMGAPHSHLFMRTEGEFSFRGKEEGGANRFLHSALTAPGMSGGPVLDKTGLVIGVNISCYPDDHKHHSGMSVAAPVSDLKAMLEDERRKRKEKEKKK
ncbi:MAG: serine protease [bacterium]|nr:serine protease [bacterium]